MSGPSWMNRNRNFRSSKSRRTKENDPDYVKLDLTKDPKENILEILSGICSPATSGISDVKLLNYLNNYIKLITHVNYDYTQFDFNVDELFCCLRIPCVHENTTIRTAGLRALRYTVKTEEHVSIFNSLQIPFLVTRSFDLIAIERTNDVERIQALKLIRRLLLIAPEHFHITLGRALVSLANNTHEEKDRMLRACLGALAELGVLNSKLFIQIGGVTAILRNILECQTPHIAESLCGTLLHLMNQPHTRDLAVIDLQCLAAPYCDFHYRRTTASTSEMAMMTLESQSKDIHFLINIIGDITASGGKRLLQDYTRCKIIYFSTFCIRFGLISLEEREIRFNCSRLALLSVLRSWPGIFHFCNPTNPTCLKAMVEILYLEHLEVKNAVLDLLYELLNLPQPEWTDEFSVALNAVDPADPQDSWRLRNGFVAAEARSLLQHLARTTPNLAEIHLSVLLYIFIEVGLFTALAEVVITGDTFICVRATILLGVLLHWTHQLLPPDCCNITPSLPNLVMDATHKHQALSAVTALQDLHTMLKQRPASYSLFLDHILLSSKNFNKSDTLNISTSIKTKSNSYRFKIYQFINKDNENLLRDSAVLQNKDGYTWDWDIIRSILKNSVDMTQKVDESTYKAFIKRLVHYFKPSSNRFSHMDLSSSKQAQKYTLAGCDLIHFLLNNPEPDGIKLLTELFNDISEQIEAITKSKSAHDCLFSPQHMWNTCCQMYFLFIGHLTHSHTGLDILTKTGVFEQLLKLATSTNHDCYVKLIITSMDYTLDTGYPRLILQKTLQCTSKVSRLYATQFLLVLLRANVYNFESWGIELLVQQLYDQSKAISLQALNILHEACEHKVYLEKLVELKPNLIHLGDKGLLLFIRFLSIPNGFAFLQQTNFIVNEIQRWITTFNYRYVRIVEEELHDSLTLHQRNEDGHYNRRISSIKTVFRKDIFIPPHLYGQLVQYTKGYHLLCDYGHLQQMFKCLEHALCDTEQEILELKASLWACGHIALSSLGVDLLLANNVFNATINIVKTCPVYSVRGTAIYVLSVMSTTYKGANELFKLGWACTRHDRHDLWPVIEGENWELDKSISPFQAIWSCWRRCGDGKESEECSDRLSENSSMQYWTDDQIKMTTGECSLPDVNSSITDDEIFLAIDSNTSTSTVDNKKSQTLPHNTSLNQKQQHTRSLSESKTIEVISHNNNNINSRTEQIPKINMQTNRVHNVSESSTSGVSSCDSVVGKFNISERIQTLSPIPSSSSLSTLKPYHRSEYIRRMPLQSSLDTMTISPTEASRLSEQDVLGYATLRRLRHPDKPFVMDQTSDDELSTIVSVNGGSSDKIKFPVMSRSLKDRPLETQHTQLSLTDIEGSYFPNPILTGGSLSSQTSITKQTSLLRNLDKCDGPCYMGICLPRKLLDIFPYEHVTFQKFHATTSSISVPDLSEFSNNNQILKTSLHDTKSCLYCCRNNSSNVTPKTLIDLFSASSSLSSSSNFDQRQATTTSFTESPRMANNSDIPKNQESRLKIDILRHVERLSNPVWYKQSRQALLHLKQKHSQLFQDICLYSEACLILSNVSMRLTGRRFLQELFQDLNFESIFNEPSSILTYKRSHLKITELQVTDTTKSKPINNDLQILLSPTKVDDNDFVKVRFFNSDSAQRSAEFSELIQHHSEHTSSSSASANKVIVASLSNKSITKGFVLANNSNEFSGGPMRSPPLASVKEETLSSVENLFDQPPQRTSDLISPPRGQKTLVDSLGLTCSQNKFPITTRLDSSSSINKNCISTMNAIVTTVTKCVPSTTITTTASSSKSLPTTTFVKSQTTE